MYYVYNIYIYTALIQFTGFNDANVCLSFLFSSPTCNNQPTSRPFHPRKLTCSSSGQKKTILYKQMLSHLQCWARLQRSNCPTYITKTTKTDSGDERRREKSHLPLRIFHPLTVRFQGNLRVTSECYPPRERRPHLEIGKESLCWIRTLKKAGYFLG